MNEFNTHLQIYIHEHTLIIFLIYVSLAGLFLVAYYLLVVLICIPVCYVQLKLGAFYKRGIVGIFSFLVPILKGVAVSLLLITFIRCLLHGVELSYCLYFTFASLAYPFIWSASNHGNHSFRFEKVYHSPSDEYFHDKFLQKTDHIGEGGVLLWYAALCLLATWTIIYIVTVRGTSFFGKIVYGLTPLTLLLLGIVLTYGYAAIPGASGAFNRLIGNPGQHRASFKAHDEKMNIQDMVESKLGSPRPWVDALHLHINSVGLWSGILPTLGAQLYHRKYIINAAWILQLLVYSILPHVAMFALAPYIDPRDSGGFIAAANGIKPGLSFLFTAIPASFDRLELSPFIAFCLYLCIFLFGLLHQALHLLTIMDNLFPATPKFLMTYFKRRECIVAVFCFTAFLLSLPFAAQSGIHLYAVVNDYVDRLLFTLVIISTVPFITGYIKQELLYLPIERACMSLWYGLSSLITAVLLVYYFAVYVYPRPVVGYDERWAEKLGWFIAAGPVILGLFLGAAHAVHSNKGTVKQRFMQSLRTDSFPASDPSQEYTSGDTADTGLQIAAKSPSNEHVIPEPLHKTETEVFIRPLDNSDMAKV
ncbi:hypothetical protein ACJMK2_006034 [Sinanodonta woodiana]|uniref:Uncharacterized protein n=1 Tax=Sinanodonta woodiana TaxID=1069815 RepID=A0ABD3VV05_SINWO